LHEEALKLISKYKIGPLFTPAVVSNPDGPLAAITSPGSLGGTNWPGGSYDPETHILYVFSQTATATLGLVKPDPTKSDMNYVQGIARPAGAARGGREGGGRGPAAAGRGGRGGRGGGEGGFGLNVHGLPLLKPPYGRITAIDLNKGEILWQVAHGETPDNIRNNPLLKGLDIPRTGRSGIIGVLTTKSLVIAGEAGFFTTPTGQRGAMLRAYDKATGKEVGAVYMPAPQSGSPMTYMLNGQQYIVLAISGAGYSAELLAFKLGA
jgi:quinoprotein glucose dehydrogenase